MHFLPNLAMMSGSKSKQKETQNKMTVFEKLRKVVVKVGIKQALLETFSNLTLNEMITLGGLVLLYPEFGSPYFLSDNVCGHYDQSIVYKVIGSLRKKGFIIENIPTHGYRLIDFDPKL